MKTNLIRVAVWGLVLLATPTAPATDLVITSLAGNGVVTWTYPTNGVTAYRLEWAPGVAGPWTNFAGAAARLDSLGPTAATMSAAVPMFYRVVASTADDQPAAGNYLVIDLAAGPSASNYPVRYLSDVPAGGWTDEYKTTKLVLRHIPSGEFPMGSPPDELGRVDDEVRHQVTLAQPFYIGVFEVTQRQWERVMGAWPSLLNNPSYRDVRPVEQVSYNDIRGAGAGAGWPTNNAVDADSFMGRLRARTGESFDLPTEAQWEYACRAGTTTALNSGDNLTAVDQCPEMDAVGRYYYNGGSGYTSNGNLSVATAKVGSYLPNAWGLYDAHGNAWERCLDWYGPYQGAASDPKGAPSGSWRVYRGGSWAYFASYCRAALRDYRAPGDTDDYVGLRVALPGR